MPKSRSGSKGLAVAERKAEVIRLRRADYTYQEILEQTGVDRGNASKWVKQHIADIPEADAKELREWERAKLTEIERSARPQAYDFFAEIGADGKPVMENVCDDNGVVMLNEDGSPMMRVRRDWNIANQGRALLLKVHERRCKMFGLDAATKTSTTFENVGNGSGVVEPFEFRVVDMQSCRPELNALNEAEMELVLQFIKDNQLGQQKLLTEGQS